jgi:hypothetical protein
MKRIDLTQTVGIVANIGVIASIIFLAVEVRDNATQARIAATQTMAGEFAQWNYQVSSDSSLAAVYQNGLESYHGLSQSDQARFDALMRALMELVGTAILARDEGLVPLTPDLRRRSLEGRIFSLLDRPGFRQWWETTERRNISPLMRSLMDTLEKERLRN